MICRLRKLLTTGMKRMPSFDVALNLPGFSIEKSGLLPIRWTGFGVI